MDNFIARAAEFLAWWARELLSFLPDRYQKKLISETILTEVRLPLASDDALDNIELGRDVVITISPEQILQKRLLLPKADCRTTQGMVNMQLARIMPLKESLIFTSWKIDSSKDSGVLSDGADHADNEGAEKKQHIQVYAVKRQLLVPVFKHLQSRNINIHNVMVEGVGPLQGFMPMSIRQPLYRKQLTRFGLALLVAFTIILQPYAWLWNVESENSEIRKELEILKSSISDVSEQQEILRKYASRIEFLNRIRETDRLAESLSLLSTESPDTVWLEEFTYEEDGIRISGRADSAAEWALRLEKLGGVSGVQLQNVSAGRTADDPESFVMLVNMSGMKK